MEAVLTGSRIRPLLALAAAALGVLAGHLGGLQPWALLAVSALLVGIAQQTLP